MLSPTASTAPGSAPTAAAYAATPAHFEMPGAITVSPQSGQIGSGAMSWPKPSASRTAATGRRSSSGRPSTENANTGWAATTAAGSAVRRTPASDAAWPGCVDGSGGSATSTSRSST